MKIYEFKRAPNPKRVQMFLVEKNIDVEYVQDGFLSGVLYLHESGSNYDLINIHLKQNQER